MSPLRVWPRLHVPYLTLKVIQLVTPFYNLQHVTCYYIWFPACWIRIRQPASAFSKRLGPGQERTRRSSSTRNRHRKVVCQFIYLPPRVRLALGLGSGQARAHTPDSKVRRSHGVGIPSAARSLSCLMGCVVMGDHNKAKKIWQRDANIRAMDGQLRDFTNIKTIVHPHISRISSRSPPSAGASRINFLLRYLLGVNSTPARSLRSISQTALPWSMTR